MLCLPVLLNPWNPSCCAQGHRAALPEEAEDVGKLQGHFGLGLWAAGSYPDPGVSPHSSKHSLLFGGNLFSFRHLWLWRKPKTWPFIVMKQMVGSSSAHGRKPLTSSFELSSLHWPSMHFARAVYRCARNVPVQLEVQILPKRSPCFGRREERAHLWSVKVLKITCKGAVFNHWWIPHWRIQNNSNIMCIW